MSEPSVRYSAPAGKDKSVMLPARAAKLARRLLQLERECDGRGRLLIEVIFIDGEWFMVNNRIGELERFGD